MNLLEAKFLNTDIEIITSYNDELLFLNEIIGNDTTKEQLKLVKHYLSSEGREEMYNMIMAHKIDNEDIDTDKFISRMNLLLLAVQFPLGQKPLKLRGNGNSNYL